MNDSFKTKTTLSAGGATVSYFSIETLAKEHPEVRTLPYSLKVLLENLLRCEDGRVVKAEDILALATWDPKAEPDKEIAFHPARVLMQDFTGVPAVVDLAAMREAIVAMGGDPVKVNPLSPADLVIDHSVQVDNFASSLAFGQNVDLEYERNRERYEFLRWGQGAFKNFRVVPPGTGICHQVNLEYLAKVVWTNDEGVAYPDTLVGTDSHTTMINGLGVLGWGVGGIEAEAALLGQPVSMLIPEVVGMKLFGRLPEGATATDLVLTVTQILRKRGVVGKFVEFYGPGLAALPLTDRATIANMAPEYGATMGFFPVDGETIKYLEFTGRKALAPLVEAYCKAQGLWRSEDAPEPRFSGTLELDLGDVVPSIAGPKRPQDRIALKDAKKVFREQLPAMLGKGGSADATVPVVEGRVTYEMPHGAVVISAITSCTNTSNPSVLVAAGLLAKKAVERGLDTKPWVKPSLAPGSKVVTDYLTAAGLMPYLEALGFHLVGYGCTTCIGNSGPLPEKVSEAVRTGDLVVASVLSGNRNFEGRVQPAGEDELPRLAAARRRLRARGRDGQGPDDRAARRRPERPGRLPQGHLAHAAGGRRDDRRLAHARAVREGLRGRLRRRRRLAGALRAGGRDLRVGREVDLREEADLLREPRQGAKAPRRRAVRPLPRPPRRLHHHRPHLPGRQHREGLTCSQVPGRQRGQARRLQPVRRPPRQPRSDDARHLRQHPAEEPDAPGDRGRCHRPRPDRRDDVDLRRLDEVPGRKERPSSSSRAPSTAPAPRATGRPRGRCSSA